MTTKPESDLVCLSEGTRFLLRRPWTTLALTVLGTVLSALAPMIQLRAGLADDLVNAAALNFLAVFPLQLYFIPRFLMAADAMAGGNPHNAAGTWKVHFEERWPKAFASHLALMVATGLGFACLILPGLLVLLSFGWVPLRVLLLGEPVLDAVKGSLRTMALAWRRMVQMGLLLFMIYLALGLAVGYLVSLFVPEPSLRQRMTHPALWMDYFVDTLLSFWVSACLLALFRRLAAPPEAPSRDKSGVRDDS